MILDYKTVVKVEKGKLVQEKTIYIQINNKQADWISDIEISYGEDDKLEILEASILNKSGELVRSLKKKEIVTKSDISNGIFYENNFVQEFKLKWHEYPYFIRYSYRHTTDNFLYIARWYPILYKSVPVLRASLEVYIPKEMKVFMNSTDSIKHTVDSTIEGDKYTWTSSYTDQIKNQPFDLNIMERIPCVGIVPEQFKYSLDGSFKSWATYGLWQSQIIDGLDELTLSEQKMVDNMVTGITDKKEIIKRLYYYLQDNTRYINVAIDEGGMIPYPASYVCTNKYGDCKALTIYMKALLKYAEIPSYYTLVNAGVNAVKIEKDFPSQQFNHVILSIPLEKDTIWLENTSKYMPFNYLGTFTQNRYGLFINGNDSRLVKLPPLDMASVENKSTYQFLLDSDGNGSITLNKNLKGYAFEAYSYINKELDLNKQKDEILEDIYVKNIENISFQMQQPDRDQSTLMLNASISIRDQFKKLGKSMAVTPFPIYSFEKNVKPKEHPVRINYPVNISDSIIYKFDFTTAYQSKLPNDTDIKTKYGRYKQCFFTEQNQVILQRQFQLFTGTYPIEEYGDFQSFIDLVMDTQQKSVIILNPN